MSEPNPIVSVIMVIYNAEKYLAKAVESVLNQSLKDFEFIILDTGSTDTSLESLKRYAQKDDRIRLIECGRVSRAYAFNEGIAHATGNFIAIVDPNDIAYRERLRRQVEVLEEDQECVALGCQTLFIDADGLPLWAKQIPTRPAEIEDRLLKGQLSCIRHANTLFRRGPLLQIHGYDKTHEGAEEFDIFIRLLRLGTLKNTHEILNFERYPSPTRQTEHTHALLQQRLDAFRSEYALTSIPFPKETDPARHKLKHLMLCARKAQRAGNAKTARIYAKAAVFKYPFHPKSWFILLAIAFSTLQRKPARQTSR